MPLWEGDDLALHTSLIEGLGTAGIRCFDQTMSTFSDIHRSNIFPIQPMIRFGYQVAVLSSDLPSAKAILKKLLDERPQNVELAEQSEASDAGAKPSARSDEEPAFELWAGVDQNFFGFLRDALRENEIPLRTAVADGQTKIFVSGSEAPRAKEILRELLQCSPPE